MTNPDFNDGSWHSWNGGECPVHPKTVIRAVLCDTGKKEGDDFHGQWIQREAGRFQPICWHNRIEVFRVMKEHREPRQWWLRDGFIHINPVRDGIHVREVMDE